MKSRMNKGLFVLIATVLLTACGDGNVVVQVDPAIQLASDSVIIAEYMDGKGYDGYETTSAGVRYFIIKEGAGAAIDESDIVTFDFIGMLTNDSIFDTSIKTIGDSIRNVENIPDKFSAAFSENKTYSSFTITYASSGWTINGQFVAGFSNGVSVTFNKMNVGGKAVIAIPSALGYGASGSGLLIPPNAVIVFELLPTEITKQ